jgi:hypothetical protein
MNYLTELRNASTWQLVALQGVEWGTKGASVVFQVLGEGCHFVGDAFRKASAFCNRKRLEIEPDGKPLTMPSVEGGSMKDDDIVRDPVQGRTVPDEFNRDIDVVDPPDDESQDKGTIIDEPPPDTSVAETVVTTADSSEEQDKPEEMPVQQC